MLCKHNTAHVFCICSSPETILCTDCVNKHNLSNLNAEHAARPLEQLPYYKIPGYFERLAARQKGFPQVQQQALDSLGDVDRAIGEYSAAVEKIVWNFVVESKRVLAELKQQKEKLSLDVEIALEEVERTMREDKPVLKSSYGDWLRYAIEKSQAINLFNYTLKTSQVPLNTLANLQYNFTSLQPFAGVYAKKAFLYDVPSQHITSHVLSVDFGEGGSHVQVDRNTLMCIGAQSASSNAYSLDLRSFQLTPLPSLGTPRNFAGVAMANSYIYVFGGRGLSSCEKMQLPSKPWAPISSMKCTRYGFTPCSFRELFYLVSADPESKGIVETFYPNTETFAALPVSHSLGSCNWSVAFIANGELCILTYGNKMARWLIDSERGFRISDTTTSPWSNQQPLIVGSEVLISWSGSVHKFSLQTYGFV